MQNCQVTSCTERAPSLLFWRFMTNRRSQSWHPCKAKRQINRLKCTAIVEFWFFFLFLNCLNWHFAERKILAASAMHWNLSLSLDRDVFDCLLLLCWPDNFCYIIFNMKGKLHGFHPVLNFIQRQTMRLEAMFSYTFKWSSSYAACIYKNFYLPTFYYGNIAMRKLENLRRAKTAHSRASSNRTEKQRILIKNPLQSDFY